MSQKRLAGAVLAAGFGIAAAAPAQAVDLLSGFGGVRDYGTEFLFRNDDSSTNELTLPFAVNFFGQTYTSFFVNNNGNITFGQAYGSYTPEPFPLSIPIGGGGEGGGEEVPTLMAAVAPTMGIIAPYWGDVDTSADPGDDSNLVWVHSPNENTVVVTWDKVGYYSNHNELRNDFQLVLRNRADTGEGNFDIDFRYKTLQWTTGDASNGSGGLGGTPAQAGFDAGDGIHHFTLPGSRTESVLELQNTSNVAADTPGLWTFAVRNGSLPDGSTPSNPLLPVVTEDGWSFQFNIDSGQRIFIDPLVAVGYDYIVDSGPAITSILLPSVGDNVFELWLWNGTEWVNSGEVLQAGVEHLFATGQMRVRILGIEVDANLDPENTSAFVTGLTFDGAGVVSMRQVPITAAVPEPETWAMLGLGLLVVGHASRRMRRRA